MLELLSDDMVSGRVVDVFLLVDILPVGSNLKPLDVRVACECV